MKQTTAQILNGLSLQPSTENKKYATKLVALFSLINEIEKLPSFAVTLSGIKGNCVMVNELPILIYPDEYVKRDRYFELKRKQDNCKDIFGEFQQWDEIKVTYSNGCYLFPFPIDNCYYNLFLLMAGCEAKEIKKEMVIIDTITIESNFFKTLDKAAKFVSKDGLRPAMQHVCIDIENYKVQCVGTDAHKLYYSPKFECSQAIAMQLLITDKAAKELAKMKFANDVTEINLLANDKIMVEGKVFDLGIEMRYPQYKKVIPGYSTFMEFDKDKFVANVKKVLPYSNKSTNQVNFHLNGSIAISSQDVDFSFETSFDMPYISKDFIDTDIAFNGKFLIDTMSIFKNKTVKMYSEGIATNAGIFSNGIDNVLLMPLMMNS